MRIFKYKLNRRALTRVLFDGAAAAAVVGGAIGSIRLIAEPAPARGDVTLYKNPQCGCCEGYADYLHDNGFKVKAVSTNDLTVMGQKYGIPDDLQPCHISLIGGYVVGGHIPMEVIDRLLSEQPKNRRDLVAGYAPGNAWYARQQARPAGHLRDRGQSAEGLRDYLNGLAIVARQWRIAGSGGLC